MARTLLFPLLVFLSAQFALGGNKKAVLIAINNYNPKADRRTELSNVPVAHTFTRKEVPGGWAVANFPDLHGPIADAELMKSLLTGMGFTEFDELYNQDATADAILSTLYRDLVAEPNAGDVRFVYYSGHGGIAKNKATHDEDQTIVPADHWRDVPDIRDKELSRILFAAGKKGVIVTMVADSCHSGSLSRGTWNSIGTARTVLVEHPVEVNDPPDQDSATGKDIDPAAVGVLFFSAAQRNEEALECQMDSGPGGTFEVHGAFTWALRQALIQGPGTADLIYQRALAFLRAEGKPQQPVLEGSTERKALSIFGGTIDSIHGLVIRATLDSVTGSKFKVLAGSALGVYEGSEFSRLDPKKPALRIRITRTISPAESEAMVIDPPSAQVSPRDEFQLEKYAFPPASALLVFVPKPAPPGVITAFGAEMAKAAAAGLNVITDGTLDRPSHVITWDGTSWSVEHNPSQGPPLKLGASPTAGEIRLNVPAGSKLLAIYPPPPDLTANLQLGKGSNTSVRISIVQGGAHYLLEGRFLQGHAEYAWVQPDATEESMRKQASGGHAEARTAMPIRSDWCELGSGSDDAERAGRSLTDRALRIARIRAWLTLVTPPDPKGGKFPYHLALQDTATKKLILAGDLKGGTKYKLFLRASEADLKRNNYKVTPRYVYVFAVDHFGKGSLIYPILGHGNEGNHLPFGPNSKNQMEPVDVRAQITLGQHLMMISPPELTYDFEVTEPFGVDTYLLMTSEQPVTNPDVFEFEGARPVGSRDAAVDPLTQLLSDVGATGARGEPVVPTDWALERLVFRSVP